MPRQIFLHGYIGNLLGQGEQGIKKFILLRNNAGFIRRDHSISELTKRLILSRIAKAHR
jgi:hypothetical protein